MTQLIKIPSVKPLKLVQPDILQPLIEEFLRSNDVMESSQSLYRRTLAQFQKWLKKNGLELHKIKQKHIILYKQDLFAQKLSELTVGSYLTVVRKLFSWLESQRICLNIAKDIRGPKRYKGHKKDPLSIDQTKEMLSTFDTSSIQGKRDFAIVNLLLRCGLRTIEVSRANIGDIRQKNGEHVLEVQGKGRHSKDAFVLLTSKTYDPIVEYLNTRGKTKPTDPLFISYSKNSFGARLTTRSISQIAKDGILRVITPAEATRITAHSLRHTAGVNVIRAGGDLYATQLFMRHEKPETTQIYLRTVEEEIRFKKAPERLLDHVF
jgi:integrase/recombinase XerD